MAYRTRKQLLADNAELEEKVAELTRSLIEATYAPSTSVIRLREINKRELKRAERLMAEVSQANHILHEVYLWASHFRVPENSIAGRELHSILNQHKKPETTGGNHVEPHGTDSGAGRSSDPRPGEAEGGGVGQRSGTHTAGGTAD